MALGSIRVGNLLFGCANCSFFDKKEQITLSIFLKERITLFILFVKSDDSDLLLLLFKRKSKEQKSHKSNKSKRAKSERAKSERAKSKRAKEQKAYSQPWALLLLCYYFIPQNTGSSRPGYPVCLLLLLVSSHPYHHW